MATKTIAILKKDDKSGGVRAETLGAQPAIRPNDEIVVAAHDLIVRLTPVDQAACDSQFSSAPSLGGSFEVAPGRPVTLTALTAMPGGFQELISGENAILHADAIRLLPHGAVGDAKGIHPDTIPPHPDTIHPDTIPPHPDTIHPDTIPPHPDTIHPDTIPPHPDTIHPDTIPPHPDTIHPDTIHPDTIRPGR